MDLLLSHGFVLERDPVEQRVMRPYPPLGLLCLSAYLKQRGHRVTVVDVTFTSLADFERALAAGPAVVGLYSNMLTRRTVIPMAALAKAAGATVVVGGPDPANYVSEYLDRGVDIIVIGEGEVTMDELLRVLATGRRQALIEVAGIAFRGDDGRVHQTAPRSPISGLDDLPLPDRSAIDLDRYLEAWRARHGYSSVSLITARGCPYACAWCSHAVFGYSHRRRSPRRVAEEIAAIRRDYDPDALWYADDVFTIHHRWLSELASELTARGLRLPFETISREDRLNAPVIRTLADMGCRRLWIGSESGSQRVLDAMDRGASAVRIREIVRLLQAHGIQAGLFVMLGYEGEELSDLDATVSHLKAAGADEFLTTVAYPIRGTPYYDRVRDRIVPTKSWDDGSDRDNVVAGRRSRRFYRHATRWMAGEVELARIRRERRGSLGRVARSYLNARLGRAGMWWTREEREERLPG